MALTSQSSRVEYTADPDQTVFPYPYKIFETTDLAVYQNGSELNTSQYSVTGAGTDDGGTVVLVTPAAAGDTVLIESAIPYTQLVQYVAGGKFPAASHERGLDRIVRQVQQLKQVTDRCLQVTQALSHGLSALELPVPPGAPSQEGGRWAPVWNASRTNLELAELSTEVGLLASQVLTSTRAGLPAAGTLGRGRVLEDDVGGLMLDNGQAWWQAAGDVVNVQAYPYRARGDGVTDDTAALQAALDACANQGGGTVLVPVGVYRISSQLIMRAGVTLCGQGMDRSVIKALVFAAPANMLAPNVVVEVADRCRVAHLTFDGNRAEDVSGMNRGIGSIWHRSTFEQVRVTGVRTHGITLSGAGAYGFSSNNLVIGCHVDNYGAENSGVGIFLFQGANYNRVIGNTVVNTEYNVGISCDDWSSGESYDSHHNLILGNTISGMRTGMGASGSSFNQYIGNNVSAIQLRGMHVLDGSTGNNGRSPVSAQSNVVVGNTFENCLEGINDCGYQTLVSSNTLYSITNFAIGKITGGVTVGGLYSNNSMRSVGVGYQFTRSDHATINGGVIRSTTNEGVLLNADNDGQTGTTVTNLQMDLIGKEAIKLTAGSRCNIQNNAINRAWNGAGGVGVGISVAGSDNVVRGNVFDNATDPTTLVDVSLGSGNVAEWNLRVGSTQTRLTIPANTASPNIANGTLFNVSGTTTPITSFTAGVGNKEFTLFAAAAVTINAGAGIKLAGGTNVTLPTDSQITFVLSESAGVAREKSRSVN